MRAANRPGRGGGYGSAITEESENLQVSGSAADLGRGNAWLLSE